MNIEMTIGSRDVGWLKDVPPCYHPKTIINPIAIPRKGDNLYLGDKKFFTVESVSWQYNENEVFVHVLVVE